MAAGENISMISEKNYKTGVNWIYIYRANLGVIGDNPDIIQPDMELKNPAFQIPDIDIEASYLPRGFFFFIHV